MRVPDISSTAPCAASLTNYQINNYEFRANFSNSQSQIASDKNGAHGGVSSTLTTPHSFLSSADQFVQKALNSSAAEEANCVRRPNSPNANDYNAELKDCFEWERNSNDLFEVDANTTNQSRRFADANRISGACIEDCLQDFKNVKILGTEKPSFYVKSVKSVVKNNTQQAECKNSQREQIFNSYKQLNNETDPQLVNEADQSMLDLSNDNSKSIYDNDGEFLTSPESSSSSPRPRKHLYFPRGIINPNYPGFQHLAHTLSEPFIAGVPSDTYDSDMSDCEMELSTDSFDDLQESSTEANVVISIYNNNNSESINHSNLSMKNLDEHNLTDFDNINLEFSKATVSDANCNPSSEQDAVLELPDNLKTVLTLFEASKGADINSSQCLESTETSNRKLCKHDFVTPDILIKSCSVHVKPCPAKENRPDLLHGVSPKLVKQDQKALPRVAINGNGKQSVVASAIHLYEQRSNLMRPPDVAKEEASLGVTPVDIIGDFGEEVEREFGLLVSGYKRLVDDSIESNDNIEFATDPADKVNDAALSSAEDRINSHKYLTVLKNFRDNAILKKDPRANINEHSPMLDFTEDNNAVDWSCSYHESAEIKDTKVVVHEDNNSISDQRPKYQKASHDDRQLPPVAIDYKRCQQSLKSTRKSQTSDKNLKTSSRKVAHNHSKSSFTNRILLTKRGNGRLVSYQNDKTTSRANRKREETEIHQYQQLIGDKELISSNSRYAKMSPWALYLNGAVKDKGAGDLISPSVLDLFDAYKIGAETDMETLKKHLKLAKEIEKKRRNEREKIRRRLAMGAEEGITNFDGKLIWEVDTHIKKPKDTYLSQMNEVSSDTESHSSDSETCPKLSKMGQQSLVDMTVLGNNGSNGSNIKNELVGQHTQPKPLPISDEDKECDFFTKQAKLQIEARMALTQAKDIAHMQMEIERQNRRMSPITRIIRAALEKVDVQMSADKRRVSRQMLTDLNIAQLQILANSLHTHIEELNESLVHFLMQRDDLHMGQDSMLVDIDKLTRYIAAAEGRSDQRKNSPLALYQQ